MRSWPDARHDAVDPVQQVLNIECTTCHRRATIRKLLADIQIDNL
jgi:hypothetical protein